MNLLDDIEVPKQPSKASLTKQATNLVGRRKTRRAKKKPKTKNAKWQREFVQAKKDQDLMKKQRKERGQMFREFERLIN